MSNYISKVQLTNNVVAEIKDANAQTSITNINNKIGTMSNLNTTDKSALVNAINEVLSTSNSNYSSLSSRVDAEELARQNADTALQGNIDAETTARQNAVNAEATARQNADNTLQTNINNVNSALSNETTARINADNALSVRINKVLDKKYLILGDSYGGQPTMDKSWIAYMKLYMGLTEGTDVFSGKLDGSGFANGKYETLIQTIESTYSSMPKTEITDIVVCGGFNDAGQTQLNVINGMISFINYCSANYQNATVHIGFTALRNDASQYNYNMMNSVLQWYKGAAQCGIKANYIVGSEWIWHNYSYLQADNIHPTAFASEYLGRGLASYFETGNVLIADTATYSATLNPSGNSTSVTGSLTEYYNGSHIDLYLELMAVTTAFSNNIVEIASFTPMHCKGDFNCRVLLPALINGTTFAQCEISFQNGKILAFPIGASNVTSIQIIGTQFSLPTIKC